MVNLDTQEKNLIKEITHLLFKLLRRFLFTYEYEMPTNFFSLSLAKAGSFITLTLLAFESAEFEHLLYLFPLPIFERQPQMLY